MEEYWNMFLNWLNNVGGSGRKQIQPARTRYAKSKKTKGRYAGTDADIILQIPIKPKGFFSGAEIPATMYRYVNEPGDTVYREYEPASAGPFGIAISPQRSASTLNPYGNLYDELKYRWDVANLLAR